jgi:hypothetical protein
LDTGALIALDHPASALLMQARLDEALRRGGSICIPVGVVAQAWRGGRPVKLARLIRSHDVDIAVMTLSVAAPSAKCAPTVATPTPSMSTSPCVREREHAVVTSDPDDLARIDPALPLIRV